MTLEQTYEPHVVAYIHGMLDAGNQTSEYAIKTMCYHFMLTYLRVDIDPIFITQCFNHVMSIRPLR